MAAKPSSPSPAAPASAPPAAPKAVPSAPAPPSSADLSAGAEKIVTAQMPGTIIDIHVGVGDSVERGKTLLILEAMKMANEVVAPDDGIIGKIEVTPGSSVNAGDVLIILT